MAHDPKPNLIAYNGFLKAAKQLQTQRDTHALALLKLLHDTEKRKYLWYNIGPNPYISWKALLKGEGLCTFYRYNAYVSAVKQKLNISKLGLDAALLLASMPAATRAKVQPLVEDWVKTHRLLPTYQRVTEYVRQLKKQYTVKKPKPSEEQKDRKIQYLTLYVKKLQKVLTKMGREYPPMLNLETLLCPSKPSRTLKSFKNVTICVAV